MTTGGRPFHHGNLRAVLLDSAERSLRDEGVESLSLRQLAREAGVSHGAPRHHFPDRQALLNALAERGFERLTEAMRDAVAAAGGARADRWRAGATAWVRFAIDDAALVDLMFTAVKHSDAPVGLQHAAGEFFATVSALMDAQPRRQLLLVATLQGIATLVTSGRIPPEQTAGLISDAVELHLGVSPDGLEPSPHRV
jgi:AcrR family transcriptional regulator